jgi:shikimate O-hydroxycinnamoyltransferase
MGNLVWLAFASCTVEEIKVPGHGDARFTKHCELVKEMVGACAIAASSSGMNYIVFTSTWCNFGLYDIDFGWGKPTWVSFVGSSRNLEDVF